MDEKTFEKIKEILEEKATPSKVCTIPLLINTCKENGIDESDVEKAIEKLQKNGDTYIIPESICLID